MRTIIILFCMAIIGHVSYSQTPSNDPSWGNPTWSDDFNGTSLDTTKWEQEYEWRNNIKCRIFSDGTPYDNDLKGFRTHAPNNLSFNGGIMTLITKTETITRPSVWNECVTPNQNESETRYYTTPKWLMSQKIFKYGYFEIKCRLPKLTGVQNDLGLGANFWMWTNKKNEQGVVRNDCLGEIDIFEFVHYGSSNHMYTLNSHYHDCGSIPEFHVTPTGESVMSGSISFNDQSFHTFGVAWFPNKFEFYHNDQLVYVSDWHGKYDDYVPMPLILDVNVFTWALQADAYTLFPYNYEVEYVKAYALNTSQCNNDFTITNFSTYNYAVYRNITVNATSPLSTGNTNLRATTSITLNSGFEVQSGAIFSADIMPCPTQTIGDLSSLYGPD